MGRQAGAGICQDESGPRRVLQGGGGGGSGGGGSWRRGSQERDSRNADRGRAQDLGLGDVGGE